MGTRKVSIHDSLVEELNRFLLDGVSDSFSIRRIAKQAESLRFSDQGQFFQISGMIATLEKDHEKMRDQFSRALNYFGYHPDIKRNFAVSLSHLGFHVEAWKIVETITSHFAGVPEFLRNTILEAAQVGRFKEAVNLIEKRKNIEKGVDFKPEKNILACSRFIEAVKIPEAKLMKLIEKIEFFLQDQEIFQNGGHFFTVEMDGDSIFLACRTFLDLDVDRIVDLNLEFAKFSYGLKFPPQVSFLFEPVVRPSDGYKPNPSAETG